MNAPTEPLIEQGGEFRRLPIGRIAAAKRHGIDVHAVRRELEADAKKAASAKKKGAKK